VYDLDINTCYFLRVSVVFFSFYRWTLGWHLEIGHDYSGRRITLSFSYVTERGEGKMERARASKTAKSLSEHV
jgi:hypothetical protein